MPTDDVIEDSRFGLIDLDDPPPRAPSSAPPPEATPAPPAPAATSTPRGGRQPAPGLAPGLEAFARRPGEGRRPPAEPPSRPSGGRRAARGQVPDGLVTVGLRLQHTDPGALEAIRQRLLEVFPASTLHAPHRGRNPRYRDSPPTWFLRGSLVMVLGDDEGELR